MSVDTKGIINKKTNVEEIYNYILSKFDSKATIRRYDKGYHDSISVSIYFKDGEDDRQLFVILDIDDYKNEYSALNFTDESKSYAWLSLGYWNNSIEIMKSIINQFGGYVDENDCDDEGWYPISANPDKEIPTVIRVTRADVNAKFGGVVIITD